MATIKDLIDSMSKGKAEERAEKKKEIDEQKVLLKELADKIEASGNKAEDNADYNLLLSSLLETMLRMRILIEWGW